MATLTIKNLYKSFGQIQAVKNFSLEIKDGEFVVFVGPSGCGKTTILRMIAGLEELTQGEIYIDDTLVNNVEPRDRAIAMVFQNYALYPHLSVRKNIEFALKIRGHTKDEIEQRVKKVTDLLHIGHLLDRKPKELSGGQRQRVAMGRALARKPKVFLFDEPLSNLDADLRVKIRTEISKLHNDLKITTIYVTHDQIEAMTLANRIVVINDGIIQQIGEPMEVYQNPHNSFVCGFIGTPKMNFMKIIPHFKDDSVKFEKDTINFTLQARRYNNLKLYHEKEILLSIRPEFVKINPQINESNIHLKATIEVREPLGHETIYSINLGDKSRFLVMAFPFEFYTIGDTVPISFVEDKMLFFEVESGKRIYL